MAERNTEANTKKARPTGRFNRHRVSTACGLYDEEMRIRLSFRRDGGYTTGHSRRPTASDRQLGTSTLSYWLGVLLDLTRSRWPHSLGLRWAVCTREIAAVDGYLYLTNIPQRCTNHTSQFLGTRCGHRSECNTYVNNVTNDANRVSDHEVPLTYRRVISGGLIDTRIPVYAANSCTAIPRQCERSKLKDSFFA